MADAMQAVGRLATSDRNKGPLPSVGSAPLFAPLNSALPKPGSRALNNTFLSFLREKGEGPERRLALCRRVQLPIFDVTVILILHGFWAKQTIKEKRAS
ncbi:hypothetical protein T4D_3985 [Trichinella pseudospiralis]|uniref:Uncharacterized protein n=1 Tax=Trichinella pseudospiralis TaxID=6337 RepID=A0A0V1FM61_TRIPS|nr:hypothetical protein T4D_3985 [Trichinella pseudospiralis]